MIHYRSSWDSAAFSIHFKPRGKFMCTRQQEGSRPSWGHGQTRDEDDAAAIKKKGEEDGPRRDPPRVTGSSATTHHGRGHRAALTSPHYSHIINECNRYSLVVCPSCGSPNPHTKLGQTNFSHASAWFVCPFPPGNVGFSAKSCHKGSTYRKGLANNADLPKKTRYLLN